MLFWCPSGTLSPFSSILIFRYFCSSSWVAETVQGCWSPRGCPRSSTMCDQQRRTDCPPAATPGGSGSAAQAPTGSTLAKKFCLKSLEWLRSVSFCVCMQPDGAESVASLYSSDAASDKRAASHHTHNSGTPTISVSRASGSSGTDQQHWLHFVMLDIIKQLLTRPQMCWRER